MPPLHLQVRGLFLDDGNYPEEEASVSHQSPTSVAGGWVHWPSKGNQGDKQHLLVTCKLVFL